jgi:hypothetical protein
MRGSCSHELARTARRVVAAALDEQQLGLPVLRQLFERHEVVADIFADGRVRTAAGLDRADAVLVERLVADQELGVFAREDVVGDDAEAVGAAKLLAERQHQRGLAAADRAADADREAARRVVARERHVALVKESGVFVMFVRMRMSGLMHMCASTIETTSNTNDRAALATDRSAAISAPRRRSPNHYIAE